MPSLVRLVFPFAIALSAGLGAGCAASGGASRASTQGTQQGTCSVELWAVSWNADGSGGDLDEDSLMQSPLARRYRRDGCDYARSVQSWMNQASPLAPPLPATGDIRMLARVTIGVSSWLLAIPITCHWVRLDRTRGYAFDPALFTLLAQPLPEEERVAVQRFGACGP
jgi:hypothetical protein